MARTLDNRHTELLEAIADRRSAIFRLITGCSLTGIAIVVLSLVVYVLATRETRDWFVPATTPGYLRAGDLSDAYVGPEAERIAWLRDNWTADTLPAVQDEFKRLLHPSKHKEYDKTAAEERKLVKEDKILMSRFVITGHDIVKRLGQRRRVLVHGVRTLHIGGTPNPQEVTIDLGLEPAVDASTGRPSGLVVMSVVASHPLKVSQR